MTASPTQIGFDRFIQLDWVAVAVRVRAGTASVDELTALLDSSSLGTEAKAKTRTKLNALALAPRPELADFIDRGVQLFSKAKTYTEVAPFAWGVALAAYPYFGRVAEFTGRLTSLQGDCSVAEIHRRMSEAYGDREITKRATQAVLQTQANWGGISRTEDGKRLVRLDARALSDDRMASWLVEAALRYEGKPLALATLQSTAVLFPFLLNQPLAYVIANSHALELRADGSSRQLVALSAGV